MNSLLLPTESESIVLRQLVIEDAPSYFDAVNAGREHLSQFGDTTAEKYPDLESVEQSIVNPTNPDKVRMGIWDGETFVGSINLTPEEDGMTAEIGYWLDGRYIGHGYATLAVKALGTYASERYRKIHADVIEGNDASIRVLERAGFRQTAKEAGRLIFELVAIKPPEQRLNGVVRSVRTEDLVPLKPILEQWIRSRDTGELLVEEVSSVVTAIEASIQSQNGGTYVVAEDAQGKVIGIMGMTTQGEDMQPFITSENPIELINAYVDKEQRGTGIGKLLAKQLEDIAIQAGHTEIIINSGPRYKGTGWAFWTRMYGEPVAIQKELYGLGGDAPVWRKSLPLAK